MSLYVKPKATATGTTMTFRVDNNNNKVATISHFDGILCVNLTETFGAGHEPSKEWCDENISYFEDKTTIYK